jgi:hypothetical protein
MDFIEANTAGARKIKRVLLKGGVVGISADQVSSVGDGI